MAGHHLLISAKRSHQKTEVLTLCSVQAGATASGTWDYTYIRELNLFIQRATASTKLTDAQKNQFIAEGRFLRASYYFEMVKRMGGVPLITEPLDYDFRAMLRAAKTT
jgi:hypothetical protein